MALPANTVSIIHQAAKAAEDKLATNIRAYDVHETVGLADAYFVATGETERQVNAIVDSIEDDLREQFELKPIRREGRSQGRWVLLDFGDVVVHIQHGEDREFYALDRLWADSPAIDLSGVVSEDALGSLSQKPAGYVSADEADLAPTVDDNSIARRLGH